MLKKMFKVLVPINKKDGTTYWMRIGTAFPNKDDSINLYLDALPIEGKLQLRAFEERDYREKAQPLAPPQLDMGNEAEALPF